MDVDFFTVSLINLFNKQDSFSEFDVTGHDTM